MENDEPVIRSHDHRMDRIVDAATYVIDRKGGACVAETARRTSHHGEVQDPDGIYVDHATFAMLKPGARAFICRWGMRIRIVLGQTWFFLTNMTFTSHTCSTSPEKNKSQRYTTSHPRSFITSATEEFRNSLGRCPPSSTKTQCNEPRIPFLLGMWLRAKERRFCFVWCYLTA